ncbi:hypothetical protein RM543_17680 [Roseicyclus sp. F158]|uniref:DUF2383 domain-containing protein n=1 Tax=Tropicimonas omnivorans TaxID=3075590 RepID=A0ABU3DLC0_9RHOB|nr:hypothetical protein [Roseicyclus sp. F158]MDT0684514.1 hypothetical protein [Roseicyclus sp. F158]
MATFPRITPPSVTEPFAHFSHTPISSGFSRLIPALTRYIECERDLEHADCFDPAFVSWTRAAERARAEVLGLAGHIAASPVARHEDLPLKRSGMLTHALIESDSDAAFTALHALLGTHAELFACLEHGVVAARTRQMLKICHEQIDAIAELGEFNDPVAAWAEPSSDPEPGALIATCAI